MLFAEPGYGNERVWAAEKQEGAAGGFAIPQLSRKTGVHKHSYFALLQPVAFNACLHSIFGALDIRDEPMEPFVTRDVPFGDVPRQVVHSP